MPARDAGAPVAEADRAKETPAPTIANRTLGQRLRRIWPYFSDCRRGFVLAVAGALVAAATEPAIPALLKVLLDDG
ncbi:MAG: lipid ABC transporter permease/ATP-binding protein, partial [Caldimonas sp.]